VEERGWGGNNDIGAVSGSEKEKGGGGGDAMSKDDAIAFMERGGLWGAMALTEETTGFLRVRGLYKDDDKNGSKKGNDNNDDDDDNDDDNDDDDNNNKGGCRI
jgi:hypothetical protein